MDFQSKKRFEIGLDWISNRSDNVHGEICNSTLEVEYIRTLTTKEAGGEEVAVIFYPKSFPRNFFNATFMTLECTVCGTRA